MSVGSYTPHNYEGNYLGQITVEKAFADSRNIPALKLAERVGMKKVIEIAHRFGISSSIPAYLPVALGAVEVTLKEQVAAYAAFPNDGLRIAPRLVRRVTDADGTVIVEDKSEVSEATSEKTARTMMTLLREVTNGGTGAEAKALHHELGGKTGTTSEFTDAWFVGFSPSVTCGVRVGYDNRESLGDKETGAKAALPIRIDFMKAAIMGKMGRRLLARAGAEALLVVELRLIQSGTNAVVCRRGSTIGFYELQCEGNSEQDFRRASFAERLVIVLPEKVKQGGNAPQWVANCKVQAHVQTQHVSFLPSQEMTVLFMQGRVAFGNFVDFPASPIAHL